MSLLTVYSSGLNITVMGDPSVSLLVMVAFSRGMAKAFPAALVVRRFGGRWPGSPGRSGDSRQLARKWPAAVRRPPSESRHGPQRVVCRARADPLRIEQGSLPGGGRPCGQVGPTRFAVAPRPPGGFPAALP